MKVALGFKAHSGWAALVALGREARRLRVVERRRVELVETAAAWARQPYHAAEGSSGEAARRLVERSVASARACALREVAAAVERIAAAGHEPVACAVLASAPLPEWSVDEILAVHFRMHKAEGALFRDALSRAAESCGLELVEVPEKRLDEHAVKVLAQPVDALRENVASLRSDVGAPWGKDQKDAALVAWVALAS